MDTLLKTIIDLTKDGFEISMERLNSKGGLMIEIRNESAAVPVDSTIFREIDFVGSETIKALGGDTVAITIATMMEKLNETIRKNANIQG